MRGKKLSVGVRVALTIFALTVFVTTVCATGEKGLPSFNPDGDEISSYAGLIFDAAGNLYGTTQYGGAYNYGSVFEVTPKAGGGWKEKLLHSFNGKDGYQTFAGVIFDTAGNLYGTTISEGAHGGGTAFELIPKAGGGWREKVLHSFGLGEDGFQPYGGLIIDASGNLYGTTTFVGGYNNKYGTVFELTPEASGGWKETVLHYFNQNGKDGIWPNASLILGAGGNLCGTTPLGGAYGSGTVFELTPKAGGGWTEKILHSFHNNGADGIVPQAGVIIDGSGSLYGTTQGGGVYGKGAVFELTPKTDGGWTEKVLRSFNGKDGLEVYGGLVIDGSGNLYGTTTDGGAYQYNGNAFELTPTAGGGWKETVLHNFSQNTKDGYWPYGALILDGSGNLYGTTSFDGAYGSGIVFELTPKTGRGWTEKVLHSFDPYR